ncbi:hypothetical protein FS749_016610 [Ceratobasidium sp. UAMH 11750]|nr:hypothetical protein FS749_016610 [Ceratobasidium sp. UAMH 11750]
MLLGNAIVFAVSVLFWTRGLAVPLPLPAVGLRSAPRSSVSIVSLLDTAQSRMNQVLAQANDPSVLDLTTLNDIVSTTNHVSNTLVTDLQILDPSLDTLMVDATGNKLTDKELATKVTVLLKGFETACTIAKDTDSGEIANIIELIALNIDDMSEGLRRVVPGVTRLSLVTNSFKNTDATISQLVNSIQRPKS